MFENHFEIFQEVVQKLVLPSHFALRKGKEEGGDRIVCMYLLKEWWQKRVLIRKREIMKEKRKMNKIKLKLGIHIVFTCQKIVLKNSSH